MLRELDDAFCLVVELVGLVLITTLCIYVPAQAKLVLCDILQPMFR